VACDFFVVITAAFRTLCVFVVMEIGSRRVVKRSVLGGLHHEYGLMKEGA
jgi:hypothetical protein